MSIVSDDDMDRLFAQPENEEPESSPEVQMEEASAEPVDTDEAAPELQVQEEPEDGHAVPYSRFSKVIAARNTAQEEIGSYQEQVSSLQQELEEARRFQSFLQKAQPQQSAQPAEHQAEEAYLDPAIAQRFEQLSQRFEQAEYERAVDRETSSVLTEVSAAAAEHPTVPEEAFYEALTRDPRADLNAFGSQYSQRIGEIEEAAIAQYLANNKGASAPDVPPEVGGGQTTSGQSTAQAPNTLTWQESLDRLFT